MKGLLGEARDEVRGRGEAREEDRGRDEAREEGLS